MDGQQDITKRAYALLYLDRRIVGVQFIYEKERFDCIDAIEPLRPMYYCQAVASASSGNRIKLTKDTSGCSGSSRALGFVPPAPQYYTGESGMALGLYENQQVAKSVALKFAILNRPLYGIVIMPLECFEEEPDVVLFITNTREAMRIVQGYTCTYGLQNNFCMSGNQAVCVECTNYPYINQCINLSVFCAGTRYRTNWKESEVAIGVAYSKFAGLVRGIQNTVNAIERNRRKAEIERDLRRDSLYDLDIQYGRTYFLKNDRSSKE